MLRPPFPMTSPILRRSIRPLLVLAPLTALVVAAAASSALGAPGHADAVLIADVPIPKASLSLSNIIIRLDDSDEIGLAGVDYRIHLIERMREKGFAALGAEDLIFGKDDSAGAAYQIGGIVRELDCTKMSAKLRCRLGIEWQLYDVARERVVYRMVARHAVFDVPRDKSDRIGIWLLRGALDNVLERPAFRRALARGDNSNVETPTFESASFEGCDVPSRGMPSASRHLLEATVLVRAGDGFGSGFFVTSDGLILTAAHVVEHGNLSVRLHDGREVRVVPVRVSRQADVALLRPETPLSGMRCLAARTEGDPSVGSELYAAGAPAHLDLAFSLTRGIVSGIRRVEGRSLLQTDTAISPGNSGGPLVDESGAVVAIVSSKLAGLSVEGVAFGVPIRDSLSTLGIRPGEHTDVSLSTGSAASNRSTPVTAFVDEEDPVPVLDPARRRRDQKIAAFRKEEAERDREEDARHEREEAKQARLNAREQERYDATPGYLKPLPWVGYPLVGIGAALVVGSYANYDPERSTQNTYDNMTAWNTVGWAAVGLGAGALLTYYIARPPLPPEETSPPAPSVAVDVGPSGVSVRGEF